MDFKTYDSAFVAKLGGALITGRKGFWLTVSGIASPVQLLFDEPEEWWTEYTLPGVNVRRVDLVPDPSRFLPGFRAYELSENPDTPNTYNRQVGSSIPLNILYEVELASDQQLEMNALLLYTTLKLPTAGYGTTINAFGHSMPFRANSIRNLAWNASKKDGRKFAWNYTYSVQAWLSSTECEKVPQVLQVDVLVEDGEGQQNTVTVDADGLVS